MRILLSGMLAGVPRQGGASWAVLQYLLGLRRLGHDVLFAEPVDALGDTSYFDAVVARFGLERRAALLERNGGATHGVTRARLDAFAAGSDVLLNISGMLADEQLLAAVDARVFVDLDPGFTQLWHAAEGVDMGFDRHERFVTIGHGIGTPGSPIPDCGRDWLATLQPVVLEHWPEGPAGVDEVLTSVGHWRAYGSIDHDGTLYGQRAHSLRALAPLPRLVDVPVALALGIHPAEAADLVLLADNDWRLVDPDAAAGTPASYEAFVRGSWAELCVAKSGYVAAGCGWFSDRSACYLASGRPVIAQDTGFGALLPTGEGLLSFGDAQQAADAVAEVRGDYARHRRAARAIAEEHLDSDRVLSRLLACL